MSRGNARTNRCGSCHLFIFADEEAQRIHSESAAVARFEAAYRPHFVGDDVVFSDFDLVASNQ